VRKLFEVPSYIETLDQLYHILITYIHTYLLTHSLSHSLTHGCRVLPEKLKGSQLAKKCPAFYGMRRFITPFMRAPAPVPILRQLNPVCALPINLMKVHFHSILSSMPGSSILSVSLRFPPQNPLYTSPLPHTCYMPFPSHSSQFVHLNNIWSRVQIFKLSNI